MKKDIIKVLPNNFNYALERTALLRRQALKDPKMKCTLIETFDELISAGWLAPVDTALKKNSCWYLPFFLTKQKKPRVVFDGAASYKGFSLNGAVYPGINLLNGLVEVLTRFRLGKYACMADLSKCFFQVFMPEDQRDLFRLIWYEDNDIDRGVIKIFHFTRHVWGINSSSYIALLAIDCLVNENPTNACQLTLSAVERNSYMDDFLLSSDSLDDFEKVSQESMLLFASRGFKLRKWVAHGLSKSVLSFVPSCDLITNLKEIDLCSQSLPDSKALGLVWVVESDRLRVCSSRKLIEVSTRRQMLSVLASQFDPLGILAPCLLGGKLILQKAVTSNLAWDDKLPDDIMSDWKTWAKSMEKIIDCYSIPRYCFGNEKINKNTSSQVKYQLHGFCDASNYALSCVVYLRQIVEDRCDVGFLMGKSKVVLKN